MLYLCTTERCSVAERCKYITKEHYAAVAAKTPVDIPRHGLYRFDLELYCVLYLTQQSVMDILGVSPEVLTSDHPEDFEQCRKIGQYAYNTGFQALYYGSFTGFDYGLCVFPEPGIIDRHQSRTGDSWLGKIPHDLYNQLTSIHR